MNKISKEQAIDQLNNIEALWDHIAMSGALFDEELEIFDEALNKLYMYINQSKEG